MIQTEAARNRLDPRDIRRRFVMPVRASEDLPPAVRSIVQSFNPPPSILRIPSGAYPIPRRIWRINLPFGWRFTPERFVLFNPDKITIIETDSMTLTDIPLTALSGIHHRVILLYAYLELTWEDGAQTRTKRMEYNSVGQFLIDREVNRIRALHPPCLAPDEVPDRAALLASLPFKFRNYLRDSLLPDEHLIAAVFQPAIWQGSGLFRAPIAPNRTLGITERWLIVLEDEQHLRRVETNYAILHYFYPLSQLRHVSAELTPEIGYLHLQFGTADPVDIPLDPDSLDLLRDALQLAGDAVK